MANLLNVINSYVFVMKMKNYNQLKQLKQKG